MVNLSLAGRRFVVGALLAAIAAVPAVAVLADGSPPPRVLADCNDIVDTTDSFSMNCVPTVIPDVSDQLTEEEVAQPGWGATPGGGGGQGPGGGPHR
ncbi:MAG: hypothetical protein KDB71_17455 [Mycobacterium sp.]|nr:hypothetical protein [Mycobacterium sp.]